jgi:hypothetical protein
MSAASRLTSGVKENPNGRTDLYGIDQFTYVPEENRYICPEGKILKYVGINKRNNTHVYFSTVKRCRQCSQKGRCTRGKYRTIAIHTCEPAWTACPRPRGKLEEVACECYSIMLRQIKTWQGDSK